MERELAVGVAGAGGGLWHPCLLLPDPFVVGWEGVDPRELDLGAAALRRDYERVMGREGVDPGEPGLGAAALGRDYELRAILIHELAHIRRHDYLANLLQRLIEALLWFHPLVWLVSREIRIEREHVCDDWVLTLTGAAGAYAQCLTDLAERVSLSQPVPASLGALHYPSNLERRILMILNDQRSLSARMSLRAVLLLAGLGLLAAFALAQVTIGHNSSPITPSVPALAGAEAPVPVAQKAPAARPAALDRLFGKLDALKQEQRALGQRRWKALSVVEQARLVLRYERQQPPSPGKPAHLTQAEARQILDRWKNRGEEGQRFLAELPLHLITPSEQAAFEQRRRALLGEIAALGQEAVPALIDEVLYARVHEPEAAEALGRMGPTAVPALLETLSSGLTLEEMEVWSRFSSDQRPRTVLLETLAKTQDPRAREVLLKSLNDPFPHIRYPALQGLEALGPVPQEVYLRGLEDEYHVFRSHSVDRLGEVGDEKAIPALLEIARHDLTRDKRGVFSLRRDAREALSKISARTGAQVKLPPLRQTTAQQPLTWEELAECAQSPSGTIRKDALRELARSFPEPRTVEVLLRMMQEDLETPVRVDAAMELARMLHPPQPGSPPQLPSRVLRERFFNTLLDGAARDESGKALQLLWPVLWGEWRHGLRDVAQFPRFPELFPLIVRVVESENRPQQEAALHLLFRLGDEVPEVLEQQLTPELRQRLLPVLQAGLEDPEVNYRFYCIEALGYLHERSVVPPLLELLKAQEDGVRYSSVQALGRFGDARALPALGEVARYDPARNRKGEFYIRQAAREAIRQIRKKKT